MLAYRPATDVQVEAARLLAIRLNAAPSCSPSSQIPPHVLRSESIRWVVGVDDGGQVRACAGVMVHRHPDCHILVVVACVDPALDTDDEYRRLVASCPLVAEWPGCCGDVMAANMMHPPERSVRLITEVYGPESCAFTLREDGVTRMEVTVPGGVPRGA